MARIFEGGLGSAVDERLERGRVGVEGRHGGEESDKGERGEAGEGNGARHRV